MRGATDGDIHTVHTYPVSVVGSCASVEQRSSERTIIADVSGTLSQGGLQPAARRMTRGVRALKKNQQRPAKKKEATGGEQKISHRVALASLPSFIFTFEQKKAHTQTLLVGVSYFSETYVTKKTKQKNICPFFFSSFLCHRGRVRFTE